MHETLRAIDRLLRGQYTRVDDLRAGRIEMPLRHLVLAGVGLGLTYGAFMGLFALFRPIGTNVPQFVSSAVKVPLLFLLTLLVTFPSLYVFSALANSRLTLAPTLRLLLGAIAVNLALLASFGPVTGFFTLSTDSYPFMVMLNVVFFAVSGLAGLAFLRRALDAVFEPGPIVRPQTPANEAQGDDAGETGEGAPPAGDATSEAASPDDEGRLARGLRVRGVSVETHPDSEPREHARSSDDDQRYLPKRIFNTWTVIYGVVGAQMGWILRPFIGSPTQPFEFFRERDSNFFEAVGATLKRLFG